MQWRAEGLGYPGPTRVLNALQIKIFCCDIRKYLCITLV